MMRSREHLSLATVLVIESRADSCFNASDTEHTNIKYRYTQCEYNTVIIIDSSTVSVAEVGIIVLQGVFQRKSGTPEVSWSLLLSTANFRRWTSLAASGTEEQIRFKFRRRRRTWESVIISYILSTDWRNKDRCVTFGELLRGAQWFSQVGNTFLHRPQSVRRPCVCTQTHTHKYNLTYSNFVCLCLYLRGFLGFLLTKFDFKTHNYR